MIKTYISPLSSRQYINPSLGIYTTSRIVGPFVSAGELTSVRKVPVVLPTSLVDPLRPGVEGTGVLEGCCTSGSLHDSNTSPVMGDRTERVLSEVERRRRVGTRGDDVLAMWSIGALGRGLVVSGDG